MESDGIHHATLSSGGTTQPSASSIQAWETRAASPSDQVPVVNTISESRCNSQAPHPSPRAEMAPRVKKPKTLAQIRDEGIAFRRAAMPVAKGSGFDKLTAKNNAFSNGTTRVDQHNKKSGDRTPSCLPAVKKIHKAPTRLALIAKKKKLRLAQKSQQPVIAQKPPIIESWRTASGAAIRNEGPAVPTPFLEIARVPTWMEGKFKIALVDLLHSLGKELRVKEIAIDPQEAGGEFYSEISARFEDEVVAQQVLKKINGVLCHGRLLQVAFAPDALHEW